MYAYKYPPPRPSAKTFLSLTTPFAGMAGSSFQRQMAQASKSQTKQVKRLSPSLESRRPITWHRGIWQVKMAPLQGHKIGA